MFVSFNSSFSSFSVTSILLQVSDSKIYFVYVTSNLFSEGLF